VFAKIWNGLVHLAFPDLCDACNTPLVKNERCICLSCIYEIPDIIYRNDSTDGVEQFFRENVHVEQTAALFHYDRYGWYRAVIHQLKYKGNMQIGIRLGEELGYRLRESPLFGDVDLLVPVPLHPKKEKIRGYNQSLCIAQGIARVMKLPISVGNLTKTLSTETQTRKSDAERLENVKNVFVLKDAGAFEGKHIVIVDDVITTGATTAACAATIAASCRCRISIVSLGFVQGRTAR
jgi:ComF family protein